MKLRKVFVVMFMAMLLIVPAAIAQNNPCNPCNPCGGKKAMNPCNPCSMNSNHFYINDPMGRNSMTFTSTAPLEDVVGTTNDVTGMIVFDPSNPEKGGHGELIIPVASLNTGIPLRDEHLQSDQWLNAKKYPNITLKIKSLSNVKEVKSSDGIITFDATINGELSFNGKTKAMEIPGRFTYMKASEKTKMVMAGDMVVARANFDVALADFGVSGPAGMNLIGNKVGKSINIAISFRASNAKPGMNPCNPCNPCGGKNPCNPCGGKNPCNPCNPCGGTNPCNPCGG